MAEISENLFCDVLPYSYDLLLSNFGIFLEYVSVQIELNRIVSKIKKVI